MKNFIDWIRKNPTIGIVTFGTFMCFMLVAADIVSAAYTTANGEVIIEAENYSRLAGSTGGNWLKSTAKSGYSGSAYMMASSGDPRTLTYSSSTARVEYDIDFKETGTYYLHLRTYATNHADNGFFATMDGRNANYGHPNAYYIAAPWVNEWWWYSDGGGAEGRGYKVSFNITTKGVHRLAIVRRDKGTRVDRIWLSKKVSTSPKTGSVNISSSQSTSTSGSSTSTSGSSTSTSGSSTSTGGSSTSTTTTGSGITFVQGADGLVKMDAFDFSAEASRSNHSWEAVRHLGVDAMEAIPDSGARIASGYVSSSPYLRFNINFQKTGTHYVWLRGSCQGSDNTAHVGLNGQALASSANVKIPLSKAWAWSNTVSGGGRATINVTKTGVQTVDVYMREDGLILEQIALATSSSYTPSGESTSTDSNSATVTGSGFLQKTDTTGLVVMNARNHDAKESRGNRNWATVNHLGVNAMEAIPDSGARIASGYVSSSPYLRFNVNFQKTGTHYVWLRGFCQGSDNTAHVGVNGNASASSANIKLPVNKGWVWSGTTMGGSRAAVSVSKTGLQTVEVYMREDGLILDKVLITSSAAYTPAGSGPAESVRK